MGNGPEVYRLACDLGAEGIVSKLASSPYRPGMRLTSWLKAKCWQEENFLVVGWTDASKEYPFGALLLARSQKNGGPAFVGRVSLGYSRKQAERITSRLGPARIEKPPVAAPLPGRWAVTARWTAPEFVARVRYLEITRSGHLRHANLKDLTPREGATARSPLSRNGSRRGIRSSAKGGAWRRTGEGTKKST